MWFQNQHDARMGIMWLSCARFKNKNQKTECLIHPAVLSSEHPTFSIISWVSSVICKRHLRSWWKDPCMNIPFLAFILPRIRVSALDNSWKEGWSAKLRCRILTVSSGDCATFHLFSWCLPVIVRRLLGSWYKGPCSEIHFYLPYPPRCVG